MTPPLHRRTPLTLLAPDADDGPTCEQLVEEGQAAERRGQRAHARECYERALGRLATAADGRRASTILRWIARTWQVDAELEAALDCLTAALAVAEAWGDEAAAGSAINVEAVVRWQQGDLDGAERLYLTARARALRTGDAKLAAMTAQNLGVLANVRGDLDEARRHYEASLHEYRALGLAKDVCVALNNLGLLHTHQQEWADAERVFDEAVQIAEAIGDLAAHILLDVNRAELWVARQEYGRAEAAVRHALALASRTGDDSASGQATKLLGVIARERGELREAEAQFHRATAIAVARQDVLLEAELARELGELARREGRNGQVLQHLNRAHRLFGQLRARRDLADIGRRTGRLEEEFLQVARRWGESIEAKDRYTQGHCLRVADLACAIAADCGFDAQALFWFRIGALLHDVGKLVIPEAVLNKPGKLTDDEWQLMRSHPAAGVEMLSGIEFPGDVLPIVRSHHERWDGRGYPDGLQGEAIPFGARILCIADVYDALTSVRSYKRALPHEEAMAVMRRDVGTMFDAELFASFERVVRDWPQAAGDARAEGATADAADVPADEDALTRLPLRRAFRAAADRVLAAGHAARRPSALLVLDVDGLPRAAGAGGVPRGETVLRALADVLREHARADDVVGRYAGEEFVLLRPGAELAEGAVLGERLRAAVERARLGGRGEAAGPAAVTISIGVAAAPLHGDRLDAIVAAADGALAAARRRGGNVVETAGGAARPAPAAIGTAALPPEAALDAVLDEPADADASLQRGTTLLLTEPADAVVHFRQALDVFTLRDDRHGQLRCHLDIGAACDRAGNHPAAEAAYGTALSLAHEVGAERLTAAATTQLGILLAKTGRADEARRHLEEAVRLHAALHDEAGRLGALLALARQARAQGDAAAAELYADAVTLARQVGRLELHVSACCGAGLALLDLGRHHAARVRLATAGELLAGRDLAWFDGRELLEALHVHLLARDGEPELAGARLRAALDAAEQADQYAAVWLAAECAAAVHADGDEWRELLRRYTVRARALGYTPLLARLGRLGASAA